MTAPLKADELLKKLVDDGSFTYTGDEVTRRDLRTMSHRVKTRLPAGKSIKTWVDGETMSIIVVSAGEAITRERRPRDPNAPTEPKAERPERVRPAIVLPEPNFNDLHRQRVAAALAEHGATSSVELPSTVLADLQELLRKEWVIYSELAKTSNRAQAARLNRDLRILHGEEMAGSHYEEDEDLEEAG